MEGHHGTLLRIIFALNFLLLFLSFTGVISAPAAPDVRSIISVMKNDSQLCEKSKFLCDLPEVQQCAKLPYPESIGSDSDLKILLCLGLYDTAYKICQYSSQDPMNNISLTFNSQFKQILADKPSQKFCNNLKGYTFLYSSKFPTNISKYFSKLSVMLNEDKICMFECFDMNNKLDPLCAILYWINDIDNNQAEKANKAETEQDAVAFSSQKHEVIIDKITEDKKVSEENETEKPVPATTLLDSKNESKIDSFNNTTFTSIKVDAEKKSKTVKLNENEIQKKVNKMETQNNKLILPISKEKENISVNSETNAKDTKLMKNPVKPQPASVKDLTGSAPERKIVNKGNTQQYEKEQDDARTTTISENTQDDPDEDVESNRADGLDDIDDIPQPEDSGKETLSEGNQNDILQEISEQKDRLQYSNARIEDESHFFTYFTVITVACIAGYIGYHNKQKILAIVLEGRRSRSSRGRRRPSTANYRKLDCTLEEAVTSQCNANVTHVIY